MGDVTYVPFGLMIAFGLTMWLVPLRLPVFRTERYRGLSYAEQQAKLRQVKRRGVLLASVATLACVGVGMADGYLKAHEARRVERMERERGDDRPVRFRHQ